MPEKNQPTSRLLDTLSDLKLGSVQSRAAVRLLAESGGGPRHVAIEFVRPGTRDADSAEEINTSPAMGPCRKCEPHRATIEGGELPAVHYERRADETEAEFERRVLDDLPLAGLPRLIIFWPREGDSPSLPPAS